MQVIKEKNSNTGLGTQIAIWEKSRRQSYAATFEHNYTKCILPLAAKEDANNKVLKRKATKFRMFAISLNEKIWVFTDFETSRNLVSKNFFYPV